MRLWLPIILIISLATTTGTAITSKKQIDMFFGMAQGNYLIGDCNGALRGIDEILHIDPDFLPALKLQARVLLDEGQAEAALQATNRAIQLAPADSENQLLKALIYGNLNRRDEAVAIVLSIIETEVPSSHHHRAANQLLGLLRMAEGEWDAAAAAFNSNYLAAPNRSDESLQLASEAYLEKARQATKRYDTDAALTAIDQAIAVYENSSGLDNLRQRSALRLLRARMLTQSGRIETAIRELQTLTGQEPDNLEALVTLASLYAASERWESVEQLIEPIALQPKLSDIALYLEGRAAFAQNRIGKARANFEAALDLQPEAGNRLGASLHFYLGACLNKLGRSAEADASILRALNSEFSPESTDEALLASQTLLRLRQAERAIPILEAVTLNHIISSPQVWAMLGRAQQANGNYPRAISALNESLQIDPNQAEALALRGDQFRKIGDLNAAAADFERALLLAPDNEVLPYQLGMTYIQLGEISNASLMMIKAAQQNPQEPDIVLLHAVLSYTLGDLNEARSALNYYYNLCPVDPAESAHYLEYSLNVGKSPGSALEALEKHAVQSLTLGYFYSYCTKKLSRKEVLDHAGKADSPRMARTQLCEALFWMAQHEFATGSLATARELLQLTVDLNAPSLAEYQLAKWQLLNLQ